MTRSDNIIQVKMILVIFYRLNLTKEKIEFFYPLKIIINLSQIPSYICKRYTIYMLAYSRRLRKIGEYQGTEAFMQKNAEKSVISINDAIYF